MKLLLTGATGFVGRNLLLKAIQDNRYQEIILPVRSREKLRAQFLGDGFDDIPAVVKPVLSSAPEWKGLDARAVDHVIHSAGVIFAQSREEYFRTNVEGTLSLLARLDVSSRIIILSSQSATGPCRDGEAKTESAQDSPVTWYGQSKLEMEHQARKKFGHLNYLCLRPPMILGARDQATLPLFKMVRNPIRFKPGLRKKLYSFISVSDLGAAVYAALDAGTWAQYNGRHFFVASDHPVSDAELIQGAGHALRRRGVLLNIPQPLLKGISRVIDTVPTWRATIPTLSVDRAKEIWPDRWVICSTAFQTAFRWRPVQDLPSSLKETCDWYLKTGQLRA